VQAWELFSQAFEEFPMSGGGVVYRLKMQHGPSNPLRLHPTGQSATLTLFPYDDYPAWSGVYPPQVAEGQLQKMAIKWQAGLDHFRQALALVPRHKQANAEKDLGVAATCNLHAQSAANQIRFCRLRDELALAPRENRNAIAAERVQLARDESELAKRQFVIARWTFSKRCGFASM
jgi:hypothetical protein